MKNIVRCFLLLLIAFLGSSAMANSTSYYAGLTTTVAKKSSGMGKVYAGTSKTASSYDATSMSASSSSTTENEGLTFYASAQANEGYEFTGWSDTDGGDVSNTENPREVKVKASSTTESSPSTTTIFANFKLKEFDEFTVTFLAPQNGSYTVDGTPVGSGGLVNGPYTEVYKPRIVATAADGYAFNGWYTTTDGGATKAPLSQEVDYTASFIAGAIVGADFVPCVKVTTAAALTTSLDKDVVIEIPAGTAISLDSDAILASGKTLIVNGDLYVNGTFTNNGTITGGGSIVALKKLVTQTGASGDTPFETTCVVASYNKKYYKTSIDSIHISGNYATVETTDTIQGMTKIPYDSKREESIEKIVSYLS